MIAIAHVRLVPCFAKIGLASLAMLTALAPASAAGDKGGLAVETARDIAYLEGTDADKERHKLDLYWPKGRKDFPVLVWVHGGGWKNGNKEQFEFLGNALAGHGVGVAVVNYRLYPKVKFPDNARDVARAFAWVHRTVGRYGGRADQVFVGGHSAGGHLASLLATDGEYLAAEKLSPADIRGVVSISGLYSIPRGRFPLFEDSDEGARKASPVRQVRGKLPPFLLVYADNDFPRFGPMAEDFAKALRDAGCAATCLKIKDRTHGSVAARVAEDGDPVRTAVLEFVAKQGGR